jgi:hypothetical protein
VKLKNITPTLCQNSILQVHDGMPSFDYKNMVMKFFGISLEFFSYIQDDILFKKICMHVYIKHNLTTKAHALVSSNDLDWTIASPRSKIW